MTSPLTLRQQKRPLIGCTTYHKIVAQSPPIEVYGLMPAYVAAIREAGGIPLLIPLGAGEDELQAIFESVDGVLLPGGGDIAPIAYQGQSHRSLRDINPDRDRVEMFMVRQAVRAQKPILAICRGHQMMNVALGGSLWEDIAGLMPGAIQHDNYLTSPRTFLAHSVQITPDSKISHWVKTTELPVNSLHHQGVRDLAPELTATAVAPDGLIEGVEVSGHPFAVGVQWHPENLIYDNPTMLGLFKGLVTAANGRNETNGSNRAF
ncbi:MAG: gamma-glutamyl-gamma-aminobutyrate hydrolase family protein [Anaerolineales bacterium]|nr:gamma-glutamyl-gamma-aminobutyrate hydrolase family protein [Anaerolineales bacterium]